MKNYIKILAITSFFVGAYSYSDIQYDIVSTTTGNYSLVDAIKRYSNITEADVNKYKLLWLCWFGAIPSLAIGGYSSYKSYEGAGMAFDYVSDKIGLKPVEGKIFDRYSRMPTIDEVQSSAGMVSDFLKTRTPWMAAAALGVGLVSYKIFYPRIRQGVLNKVQKFIDVCSKLTFATQSTTGDPASWGEWKDELPIKVCLALDNLKTQAEYASILLKQVGLTDIDTSVMHSQIFNYQTLLLQNSGGCDQVLVYLRQTEQAEKNMALQQNLMGSQITGIRIQNVKNVLSIMQKVGSGMFNFARDVANFGIANKEPLGMLGAGYWLYKKVYPTQP